MSFQSEYAVIQAQSLVLVVQALVKHTKKTQSKYFTDCYLTMSKHRVLSSPPYISTVQIYGPLRSQYPGALGSELAQLITVKLVV